MRSFIASRRIIISALTSSVALLAFWWVSSTPRVIAQGPPVCVTPPTGMVSWWPGEGNANDIHGSNNGNLVNGATFAAGKVGQAFSLDGVDDYITVPNVPALNPSTLTVMAWYLGTSFAGNGNNAIVQKAYVAHSPPYYQYQLGVAGDLYPHAPGARFGFSVAAGGVVRGVGTVRGFWIPGRWYHVAGTYDGTAVKLYVDGSLVDSSPASGGLTDYGSPLLIGGFANLHNPSIDFTPGTIDEVAIFDRALSASEIQSIFNAGSSGKCNNTAPVATCQNVTVPARRSGATCTNNASIDAGSYDPDGDTITVTQSPAGPYPLGTTTVTLTVIDDDGASSSCTATVTVVDNAPPVITCPAKRILPGNVPGFCSATVSPGTATAIDNCAGVSIAGVRSDNQPLNNSYPLGVTTINWTATDAAGNDASCQQTVTVTNPAPAVSITGPPTGSVYAVNTPVSFTGSFADNPGGTHTATWMFDNWSSTGSVNETTGDVTGSFTFTAAGVYKVTLTVTDDCGGMGSASTINELDLLVVIYDPGAGFVTGGGWIHSPAGAYVSNPSLTGKANFGFVSKYHHGATVPTGNTEFQFKSGSLNFHSTSYDWLVIAGKKAQYKGSGKINGTGDYDFMLTAIDGQQSGEGGVDKFRIRIWDRTNGGLIYDNQLNAPDSDDPTTLLGGGNIVIHK